MKIVFELKKTNIGGFFMKKGIVIALAIAVVFMFVGCGIQSQLKDTAWGDTEYVENYKLHKNNGLPAYYVTGLYYKFNSDGTYDTCDKDLVADMDDFNREWYLSKFPSGTWFCEGHELHMKVDGSSVGTIYDASISGDTLTLKDKSGSAFLELYRIE
jgi:uncharacterized lipoprotein NlpE involved in copper resistance